MRWMLIGALVLAGCGGAVDGCGSAEDGSPEAICACGRQLGAQFLPFAETGKSCVEAEQACVALCAKG